MTFPVRLYHAAHGFTHAHDTQELERLKNLGWDKEPAVLGAVETFNAEPKKKRAYNRKAA